MPFDLGAHWIYSSDVNPVTKAPRSGNLEIYPAPPGQRVRIGRRNARESELEDFLSSLVRANRAIGDAARGKVDIHCAQALPKDLGEWKPTVEFVLGPYNCATDLNEISAMDLARAADRDSNAFCRQGFGALLASSRRQHSGAAFDAGDAHRHLEQAGGVEVRTPKGTLQRPLRDRHGFDRRAVGGKIAFAPELPKRQLDALAKLKLGSFDHIALEFTGNPLGLQRDDLVFEKSANTQTGALLANIGGTSLATVSVGGQVRPRAVGQGRQGDGRFRDRLARPAFTAATSARR